jgi:hypothetical protein
MADINSPAPSLAPNALALVIGGRSLRFMFSGVRLCAFAIGGLVVVASQGANAQTCTAIHGADMLPQVKAEYGYLDRQRRAAGLPVVDIDGTAIPPSAAWQEAVNLTIRMCFAFGTNQSFMAAADRAYQATLSINAAISHIGIGQ